MRKIVSILLFAVCVFSCGKKEVVESPTASGLMTSAFEQKTENGDTVRLYTLQNASGMEVCVINTGARIVSIVVPDKEGNSQDVLLGYDNGQQYASINDYMGAVLGRYANRISGGKMVVDRVTYHLRTNDGDHVLHGGPRGFHTQYFNIEQLNDQQLICTYFSKNNEEGFPGNLDFSVTYTLTDDNALDIAYEATTDRATVINPSNNLYVNLSGNPETTILDHSLYINASQYTPLKEDLIPTGKIEKVTKALDFSIAKTIGSRLQAGTMNELNENGYDVNYVLNNQGDISEVKARLVSPVSGIVMEVYTTEPGMQLYTANHFDGSLVGKKGIAYSKNAALCLETQHYPDSPNQPKFPTTVLRADSVFTSQTIYKFSTDKPE